MEYLNISRQVLWIAMIYGTDIHGPQRMIPNNVGDHLTSSDTVDKIQLILMNVQSSLTNVKPDRLSLRCHNVIK